MALTEYAVLNPRRRRRRKRARATTKRVTRRRRRRALAVNPRHHVRRRRRVNARRRHSGRRRRHNPRIGGGGGSIITVVKHAGALVVGAAVAEIGVGFIAKYLPPSLTGPTADLVNAGIGIVGIPMLVRMTPFKRFAGTIAAGAAAIVLWNAYQTYVKPHIPLKGLGIYDNDSVAGLGTYGPAALTPANYGGGVAGLGWGQDSMYSDSMYT